MTPKTKTIRLTEIAYEIGNVYRVLHESGIDNAVAQDMAYSIVMDTVRVMQAGAEIFEDDYPEPEGGLQA